MTETDQQRHYRLLREHADEQDAQEVERSFSTARIHIQLKTRKWVIPANYFSPMNMTGSEVLERRSFGFKIFFPNFEGFDKENWRKGWFDERRIDIVEVSLVDKTELVPNLGGGSDLVSPAAYGDPNAQFENIKPMLADKPELRKYGLVGYQLRNGHSIVWSAHRSNGEFFFFFTYADPEVRPASPGTYPLCDVRYYSAIEDMFVAYRYSSNHIAQWREIDDGVWKKLHEWEVR